jgi:hypothetical protein
MFTRGVLAILVGGVVAVGLSGCFGAPAAKPSTSAPAFASDKEAYAAAEKTYRAYVDGLNRVDLADPKTFEPVFALTTGEMNASDRKTLSTMHAEELVMEGDTVVRSFQGEKWSPESGEVNAVACSDVHAVTLIDGSGESKVNADRPPKYRLELRFIYHRTAPQRLLVARSVATDAPGC